MSELPLGLIVESMVAALLFITIIYCIVLNRKLNTIRRDQRGFKKIISDLKDATAHAEGAISGLRFVVIDAEQNLAGQIEDARDLIGDLEDRVRDGNRVVAKLGAISRAAAMPKKANDASPAGRGAQAMLKRLRASQENADRRVNAEKDVA